MDEDRRRILDLLQQQRISPQEAAELLEALGDGAAEQRERTRADEPRCGEDAGPRPEQRGELHGRVWVGGFGRVIHAAFGRRPRRARPYD